MEVSLEKKKENRDWVDESICVTLFFSKKYEPLDCY